MEKETDINKVFGKMPEAEELLEDNSMEKESKYQNKVWDSSIDTLANYITLNELQDFEIVFMFPIGNMGLYQIIFKEN